MSDGSENQARVDIKINRKRVAIDGDDADGAQVKAAAIHQGVEIKSDFILSMKAKDGKWDIIGDRDTLDLHDGDEFRAVAPEEHS